MLAMCLYHHARLSAGGRTNRRTSKPAMESPTKPKTMATVESSWNLGVGLAMPSITRVALAASVIPAAAQSSTAGRWPRSGRLRWSTR